MGKKNKEHRKFIRHPSDIPIEITAEHLVSNEKVPRLTNVSLGGLTFFSDHYLEVGSIIRIKIPSVKPVFETESRVAWCRKSGGSFEAGVEFLAGGDAFKARLVEQVCYIEHYRKEILEKEGRALTGEEAAREWIDKYASHFPNAFTDD